MISSRTFYHRTLAQDIQTESMQIRLATLEDISTIMQLVRLVVPLMRASGNLQWNDDYPDPEAFARDIFLSQLWVADSADEIAGVAALTTEQEPEYEQAGWDITVPAIVVHRLAVHPDFQGQGVGAALMQQAEHVARERGIEQVRVDTNSQNHAIQRLLSKLGYRFVGEIALRIRPGLRFFCYDKLLPPSD